MNKIFYNLHSQISIIQKVTTNTAQHLFFEVFCGEQYCSGLDHLKSRIQKYFIDLLVLLGLKILGKMAAGQS